MPANPVLPELPSSAAARARAGWGPQRIVCLTEETTEWLYLLGEQARIVGISGYTVRPRRAREEKPKVSAFLSAKIDKILALQPDCVFGFSDLQADIAAALIRHGVQVTVFNQRSVAEIFSMLCQVAAMVGQADRGAVLLEGLRAGLQAIQAQAARLPRRPSARPRATGPFRCAKVLSVPVSFGSSWSDPDAIRSGHRVPQS